MQKDEDKKYFSADWWRENKADSVKDHGLERAIAKYKGALKLVKEDPAALTEKTHQRLKALLDEVGDAAAKTHREASLLGKLFGGATRKHLETYPEKIKEEQTRLAALRKKQEIAEVQAKALAKAEAKAEAAAEADERIRAKAEAELKAAHSKGKEKERNDPQGKEKEKESDGAGSDREDLPARFEKALSRLQAEMKIYVQARKAEEEKYAEFHRARIEAKKRSERLLEAKDEGSAEYKAAVELTAKEKREMEDPLDAECTKLAARRRAVQKNLRKLRLELASFDAPAAESLLAKALEYETAS